MTEKKRMNSVRAVALDALLKIEKEGAYSNLLLNQVLQSGAVKDVDKGLFTELMYGTIQYKATIDGILKQYIRINQTQDWLLMLLRLSVYQIVFLDRVPDHAIVNEAVEIAKKRSKGKLGSFVNGVLRAGL